MKKDQTNITCYYCNGNHNCRDCPIESKLSGYMKKIVGQYMENLVAKEIKCKYCNQKSLKVLGNNTPSLDIKCTNCSFVNIECKSKCLSVKDRLPYDLFLNHGNFEEYRKRQKKGLDFIIIIYKVDRKNKILTIRKVLYVDNKYIQNNNNFTVIKKPNSGLSNILIKNHYILDKLELNKIYSFSFKKVYEILKEKIIRN